MCKTEFFFTTLTETSIRAVLETALTNVFFYNCTILYQSTKIFLYLKCSVDDLNN